MKPPWDIPAAISLYNIDRWGSGYFTINEKGNISGPADSGTPLGEDRYDGRDRGRPRERGLNFPLVLRFQDLLRDRVETINKCVRFRDQRNPVTKIPIAACSRSK